MRATSGVMYCVIADAKGQVITEHARIRQGTVGTNAKRVLNSIPKTKADKRSYNFNDLCYNIIFDSQGCCYMSVTDEHYSRVRAFQFLEEVKKKFEQSHRQVSAFAPELKEMCEYYSDPKNDKLQKLREDIDDVKGVMIENIDKMLERGEQIDTVVEKTDTLAVKAKEFNKKTTDLKRKLFCRRMMMWFAVFIIVLIIIFIVVLFACSKDGINFDKCFGSNDNDGNR